MDSHDTHQGLKKARDLLSDRERWIQGDNARDADGSIINAWDDRAVCWCADGALEHVFYDRETGLCHYADAAMQLRQCTSELLPHLIVRSADEEVNPGDYSFVDVNDGYDGTGKGPVSPEEAHKRILSVFDCAIAKTAPPST